MNDYNKVGYIGQDTAKWYIHKGLDQNPLYTLSCEINSFLHPLIFKLQVHNENIQEIITSILFYRALGIYQGMLLLIQRGMLVESKYLLRVLLEIKYKIIVVAKDFEHAKDFARQDIFVRKRRINDYCSWSDELKKREKTIDVEKLKKEIEEEIKRDNIKYHDTKWYAKESGLLDDYCTAWVTLSGEIHVSIRELEDDFVIEHDEITSMKTGHNIEEFKPILQTQINSMLRIANAIPDVFSLDINDQIGKFVAEFKKICDFH